MFSLQRLQRLSFLIIFPVCATVAPLQAQHGGGSGGGTGGAPVGAGSGSNGSVGMPGGTSRNTTGYPNSSNSPSIYQDITRPVFLSGRVVMDDGSKPTSDVTIQRVCNGNPHTEAHVDSRGHFSFQVGANPLSYMDASESSVADPSSRPSMTGNNSRTLDPLNRGVNARDLNGCQLQAYFPGYRSDAVNLDQRHALDNPDVGTIVLHRLGNVQGTAVSITTEMAPKKARKDYEKGLQLSAKGKTEEAAEHFQSAVAEYPKFAIAWYELGRIQVTGKNFDGAQKSFEAAIAADSKYVSPYDSLANIAVMQGKWTEAADRSKQAVYLNPVEFPTSWFYNALANYNLKNPEAAEKSAKEVIKLDGAHRLPQAETLLAQICADRSDYAGAVQHLQTYLQLQPNSPNAPTLRQQLAKLQESVAQTNK
jgi:tetratricopeptide (TPR) repeat protein